MRNAAGRGFPAGGTAAQAAIFVAPHPNDRLTAGRSDPFLDCAPSGFPLHNKGLAIWHHPCPAMVTKSISMKRKCAMHMRQKPEDPRISAFRQGLRDSLAACGQILCSPNYQDFLRSALEQGEDDILRRAVYSGHESMLNLLRSFLAEAATIGILRDTDHALEAEMLLGQIQGNDFIHILLCRHAVEPALWRRRIDAAVAAFCKANLVSA